MKVLWVIAYNTFREIMRDRIMYGLIVFALLLIGLSLVLGQLSFAEQTRISANFGMTAIHVASAVLAVFIGSTLVSKEIDKKTVMTLLVRPITRLQFLVGKALGLLAVIVSVIAGLSSVLLLIFAFMGVEIQWNFLIILYGVVLEAMVLLSIALLFSTFTRPMLVVSFCVGLFFIGHWMSSLRHFSEQSSSQVFRVLEMSLRVVIPNLETFNWRSTILYSEPVSGAAMQSATFYALVWVAIPLLSAAVIIGRKDFG